MIFNGFRKMTLLDFPGRVACTLFTGGCNFRCPFCHNASLVVGGNMEQIDEAVILDYLKKRTGLLDGVCITGGEPTLRPDLIPFIEKVKALGFEVKLDTNGTNPTLLKELLDKELVDYVAMDVKNSFEKYPETCGLDGMELNSIKESIALLIGGKVDFEFRTTVVSPLHEAADIEALAKEIRGAEKYFIQNFVDSGDLLGGGMTALPRETLDQMLTAARKYIPKAELRGV